MGDRFYEGSFPYQCSDDYNEEEEEEESEGEYEEEEVNDIRTDEKSEELACPFCLEDFDVLGLCCHIDTDHRMEDKPGICPLCDTKVRINMAAHVITQHEKFLKTLCNKKNCSSRSRSTLLLFRKELLEKYLRSIKESSLMDSSSNGAADSMLLSFVNNPQPSYKPQNEIPSSNEVALLGRSSNGNSLERVHISSLATSHGCKMPPSVATEREQSSRCEFLQGLLLSTILDDQ